MIKIILGNYILSSICRAASLAINILVNQLQATPDMKFAWLTYAKLWAFFTNAQTTIVLILYIILIVIIYKKSKIHIHLPMDEASKKMLQIFLVPMTVISVILTLQVALMGMDVGNVQSLQRLGATIATNPYIIKFFSLTPVRILLHGIITIFITSELKISVKTDIPPL